MVALVVLAYLQALTMFQPLALAAAVVALQAVQVALVAQVEAAQAPRVPARLEQPTQAAAAVVLAVPVTAAMAVPASSS